MQNDAPLADIITYRMGRDMVYIPLARTYSEALQLATKVFPRLSGIDSDQICLTLTVTLRGQSCPVRISPMSWSNIRTQVVQYEILDVAVADKVLWENITELEETSPSARAPPPAYHASVEPSNELRGRSARSSLGYLAAALQGLRKRTTL